MLRVAIHSMTVELEKLKFFRYIFEDIVSRNIQFSISKKLSQFLSSTDLSLPDHQVFEGYEDLPDADYFFSIGGDGTLLDSVTYVRDKDIPILGINTGRLGFLSTTPNDKVKEAIDALFHGYYTLEERSLIQVESNENIFNGLNFGLNEFTILKRDSSSMIVVHTFLDGEYLNSYWSDGLIVATPTGSTGYSLSVGGPVVIPDSNNFIISPVSPHNLNVRPLVVSDNSIISFEIEGRSRNFLVSLDSRSKKVDASAQIAVRKGDFTTKLVKLNGENFLNTLRLKLNWGLDMRN
ncbi:NAD kinase [Rapidithrix thailandica]|uniref:NAD kinase n=1 Tax=Rapidithrix thailandica TaxID=413964 RepID=A0AAW9S7H5_9BACT